MFKKYFSDFYLFEWSQSPPFKFRLRRHYKKSRGYATPAEKVGTGEQDGTREDGTRERDESKV